MVRVGLSVDEDEMAASSGHLEHRLGANCGSAPRPHPLNTLTAGCHVAPKENT